MGLISTMDHPVSHEMNLLSETGSERARAVRYYILQATISLWDYGIRPILGIPRGQTT